MVARLPPLCCSCLRSRKPPISTGAKSSGLSIRLTLRRLLVLFRVVKLGFRLRRDASAADSEDGPSGALVPTRMLSARLTPTPPTTRERSDVEPWSSFPLEPSADVTLILGGILFIKITAINADDLKNSDCKSFQNYFLLYLGEPSIEPWNRSDPPETELGPEPPAAPFMFKGRRSSSSRVSLISWVLLLCCSSCLRSCVNFHNKTRYEKNLRGKMREPRINLRW